MSKKLTNEEFISKSRVVHGDKYDYSNTNYKNSNEKVIITCPSHGEFRQLPLSHLQGRGCPCCANDKRRKTSELSQEEFIGKAKIKHKNKYDYTKTIYNGCNSRIIVTCPIHGDFSIIAYRHLSENGCPKCAMEKRKESSNKVKTKEEFVNEVILKFGDILDLSEVEYKNAKTKVWVTNKLTMERYQVTPTTLLTKGPRKRKKIDKKTFIEESIKKHGKKYDYSKVHFNGMSKHVIIICPEHGEFKQKPNRHLKGEGCPLCGHKSSGNKLKLSKEEFIEKAKAVHGNYFSYEKFNYTNYHAKSIITCPKHGDFMQSPLKHLEGHGCPKCNESSLEKELRIALDKHGIKYTQQFSDKWLKNGRGLQKIDFRIDNTDLLIECQGIQHFMDYKAKFILNLKDTIERDERKYNLALKNGYKILYYVPLKCKNLTNVSPIYKDNTYHSIEDILSVINNNLN